jgi:electron transfer flavoprotein alpha subunit
MSILIYTESNEGTYKKAALELASYAKSLADSMGTSVTAVSINSSNDEALGSYGVAKVLQIKNDQLLQFSAKAYASAITQAAKQENANIVLFASTTDSFHIAPLVAMHLDAGMASNVIALPVSTKPFQVKRTAFSNKAFSVTEINTEKKVIAIAKNAYGLHEVTGNTVIESFNPTISSEDLAVKITNAEKSTGKVTIADAEVVVSAGRGLKGPENWGMIEELATVLGAATACSKPVSDIGWRPHSEHVGQTGKPVAANLYIAVGISGAIQHIAGVNSSKVKVVINTDADAPFFKVADYGIVGDAFDVVPKLIEKLKAFKASNA